MKNGNVSVESDSRTAFAVGLVIALSFLFMCLNWVSMPYSGDDYEEVLEDIIDELDTPPTDHPEIQYLDPTPPMPVITADVKAVDTPEADKLEETIQSQMLIGDGEALSEDAEIEETTKPDAQEEVIDFRIVQQIPEFPGGVAAFMRWITKNLPYPKNAQSQRIQGKVVVSFIVETDGQVSNIKIEKGVSSYLDIEVMRLMQKMPKWQPGIQNDAPCRTMMAVPIVFEL